jgi:nucleoside-diphosphate-sugar epimerase
VATVADPGRSADPIGRVLITGALGFIGRAVGDRLRAEGVEVRGVDRAAVPELGVVAGDTTDPAGWALHAHGCDAIVHTAAVVSNAVDADEQWRINVLGTRRVIETARDAGVRRVVHLSSIRAFSDVDFPDGVTEDHPVRPDGNPYVDTKIASEHVALQAHAAGEVESVVVRPGDVYGPGSRPWVLLPLEAMKARQFLLPAMGRGIHSPVHVDDLVAGVLLALRHPDAAGEVFTLAGPRGVRSDDYFGRLHRMLGRGGRPLVLPTPAAVALAAAADRANRARGRRTEVNAISMRYLARSGTYSIAKARRVLGYSPAVELDEGMRGVEAWLRAEGHLPR